VKLKPSNHFQQAALAPWAFEAATKHEFGLIFGSNKLLILDLM